MDSEWTEKIVDWPALDEKRGHHVRVVALEKLSHPAEIRVCVEHLHEPQQGRQHEFRLPLPIHPGGPTSEFFAACRMATDIGHALCPTDALKRILQIQSAELTMPVCRPTSGPSMAGRNRPCSLTR